MTRWQARDPSKLRKAAYILFSVLTVFVLLSAYFPPIQNGWKLLMRAAKLVPFAESISHDDLHVHVIDVGKADAILIESEAAAVLVDTGTIDYSEKILNYLYGRNITKLDALVVSHADSDHLGGAENLLQSVSVEEILCSPHSNVDCIFPDVNVAQVGDVYEYGDFCLEIIGPEVKFETENDNSLVFRLRYETFTMLFCGDIEREAENALLLSNVDLKADVLKVPHHGSDTSSSALFLDAVSPSYAVISTGEDQSRLPRNAVLKRLHDAGIEFFRTDKQGTIVFSVNGEDVKIKVERE